MEQSSYCVALLSVSHVVFFFNDSMLFGYILPLMILVAATSIRTIRVSSKLILEHALHSFMVRLSPVSLLLYTMITCEYSCLLKLHLSFMNRVAEAFSIKALPVAS